MRSEIFTKTTVLFVISLNANAKVRFADMKMALSGQRNVV